MPEQRSRQPRRFPVAWLEDPTLVMTWADEPQVEILDSLDKLARDVPYMGHSSSFARCRFRLGDPESKHQAAAALRRIYPGRLEELETAYQAIPPIRPRPGASVFDIEQEASLQSQQNWLVLEHVNGKMPDIRASALVCQELRRAIMSGYKRAGLGDAIPEVVSGHSSNGEPTKEPHLSIVPMAFAGFEHADGRVLGFALIPPKNTNLLGDVAGFREAFAKIAAYDHGKERNLLNLKMPDLTQPIQFSPVGATTLHSLDTERYLKRARVWASVTPIVLDRHLKQKGDLEVQEMIADACVNAGLPRPDPDCIWAGKHSAVKGAAAAKPLAGEPRWMRWKVPEFLATRSLTHAVIDFGQMVEGPVLLGAGRFTGLGLCCGLDNRRQ